MTDRCWQLLRRNVSNLGSCAGETTIRFPHPGAGSNCPSCDHLEDTLPGCAMPTVRSLPVLPVTTLFRVTPTNVFQFESLGQCERFPRLRLSERAGQRLMKLFA